LRFRKPRPHRAKQHQSNSDEYKFRFFATARYKA
jgi:hypothetical protein